MNSNYSEESAIADSIAEEPVGLQLAERVIGAVAAAKDENPIDLRPPLYDAIDPEALDALFDSNGVSVEFTWQNCRIAIDEAGTIRVTDRDQRYTHGHR